MAQINVGVGERHRAGDGWFGGGAMRAENVRLRALLARSEAVSSRYVMLLHECDHRVKNSLQIVASLMRMQARGQESPFAAQALRSAAERVQSIARIHDALQASGGEDNVDLGAAIESVCRGLQAMAGDAHGVTIAVNVEPIQAPVAFAQPVVLAVNELVVNSLRHAFPDGRTGTIRVSVAHAGGEFCVIVADDGVGLPADYVEGHGYGLSLVHSVVAQIGGTLNVESKSGARFTLVAPAPGVSARRQEKVAHLRDAPVGG